MKWKDYRDKILATIDAAAFYTGEFEALGLQCSRHGNELKASCPFSSKHRDGKDTTPSFTVNLDKGVYFCNACGSKGNVHTFYSIIHNTNRYDTWLILGDALGIERPADVDTRPGIDPALPLEYHKKLMECTGPIRDVLKERRGLTDETLKRFCIGWDGERVTIPIYDEFDELVNIRRHKWNSFEGKTKMLNYEDEVENAYGEQRIYGIEHLFDDECEEIYWCEGEWDRIIAEQNSLPTCTMTAGAGNFRNEWYRLLRKKKRVFICYDNDQPGKLATSAMVENLRNDVELHLVQWPKDFFEKGDVTDIFVKCKYTADQFKALFKQYTVADVPVVSLASSSSARYAGRRMRIPVLVAGKENAPFIYPQAVRLSCDAGDETCKLCMGCALLNRGVIDIQFNSNSSKLLRLIECTDEEQYSLLKSYAGVTKKCPVADVKILDYKNLESVQMIPKADSNDSARRQEYVARMGFVVSNNLPTNKRYTLVGYMHADPRTQRSTYIFDEAIPEKDILDELEVTPELHEKLKTFQCAEGQSVADKFNDIHSDLERNVTYIWNRRKVAYAVDLVYHTVLSFIFQEQRVKRGWAECLIIGDSGQAKTTLVERLMTHYKCGELISGEAARRTGLVYSLQQSGSKGQWTLIWGAMPLNDGGLLTIDELSGMSEDDLAKMSDVRSSGVAKATGVVTAETMARTRIIFISNPRNGRQLRAETYGVNSVIKLFGKAEDVRRLDFAVSVASGEVDSNIVNKSISDMPAVEHRYTSELCKLRVLWAWSRKYDQVRFTDEAVSKILEYASKMGQKYSSKIPLVEPADQRLKLARLAVSAAACVYSTDDGTNIIVKPEHVEFVYDFLTELYDSKSLGYDRMSADEFENSDTTDGAMQRLRNGYISLPLASHDISEVTRALYKLPYFNRNALEDATGLDRDELRELLQFLISSAIVEKAGQDYKRTPMGLAFIEGMLTDPPTDKDITEARAMRFKNSEL